jgi:PepSY-associated TM region
MMKLLRKWLILTHRYAGIVLSLLVVLWFATGITMMYAGGMPRLTPETRLEKLPNLDLARVRLTPAQAAEAGLIDEPGRAVLLSIMGRPAYRFGAGEPTTVFADTGEVLEGATLAQVRTIASRFAGVTEDQVNHVATLTRVDQWTLVQSRQLPLHKFRVNDEHGTELYVSPRTGEVTMVTTRRGRALAWISTIPHFFYFAALRENQPVWYQFVVWTSGLVCALAVLGLVLGVVQSFKQKYTGAMKWHYVTGLVFGVFTATWAFSGLLSMEPFEWTNSRPLEVRRDVFTGGPIDLGKYAAMRPAEWDHLVDGRGIKEIELARIQDEHYYMVRLANDPEADKRPERLHQPYYITGRAETDRLLVRADTLQIRREPFSVESLVARLRAELPEVPILEQQLLAEYDSYYYSRQHLTPLPVLRVKFADPGETWFYIDPSNSTMLSQVTRLSRVERWLYNGLHTFDFPVFYDMRPLWDTAMIVLLLGCLASSSIGLGLGFSRVARGVRRLLPSRHAAPAPTTPLQERDA